MNLFVDVVQVLILCAVVYIAGKNLLLPIYKLYKQKQNKEKIIDIKKLN